MLAKLPKSMQPKVKDLLHEIWQSETKAQAMDDCIECYEIKYPKATKCLKKDRGALLTFTTFPPSIGFTYALQIQLIGIFDGQAKNSKK